MELRNIAVAHPLLFTVNYRMTMNHRKLVDLLAGDCLTFVNSKCSSPMLIETGSARNRLAITCCRIY